MGLQLCCLLPSLWLAIPCPQAPPQPLCYGIVPGWFCGCWGTPTSPVPHASTPNCPVCWGPVTHHHGGTHPVPQPQGHPAWWLGSSGCPQHIPYPLGSGLRSGTDGSECPGTAGQGALHSRALCHHKPSQCSLCIPQKTLTANRNKEMPRHESGGNPHPKSGRLQPLAASGRAERKGHMCRTRLRCCLCVQTHTQSTRGFSNQDRMRVAGTGWRMQDQAPRRPQIGKVGQAAGMLPPFL